jgi:ABC-type polysaccharide/polyol phosphate export permease
MYVSPHPIPALSGGDPADLRARVFAYIGLVRAFVIKDIRARYVGSLMGFFWTVIHPLVEITVYTLVFTVILKVKFEDHYSTWTNALFLFCGMVPWFTLSETLSRCTNAIRENSHLLKKVRFPASVLCTYILLSEKFNQTIRFSLLALAALLLSHGLSWHALLVIPMMFLGGMFALGLGLLLATTQVFFKDTQHLLGPILMIWLFITPIFYPARYIPEQAAPLLVLNPLAHLVGIHRELLLNQRLPHMGSLVIFGTCAVLVFVLGVLTFQRHAQRFPDLV